MTAAVPLRTDFDAATLRLLAGKSKDARQSRRLLSIAAIYDGMNRGEAAKIGGMDRQILRDWVVRFNEAGADGLIDCKSPGPKRRLSEDQMRELADIVETGPDPVVDGVVRWRICDLQTVIERRFGVAYKERAISNLLKALDFSRISGRPQHPKQDERVIEAFKKNFPATLAAHIADLPKGTAIEIWWQDEARLGQKNGRTRIWAKKGTRPRLPADQRYKSAYLFGAICPRRGTAAALMLPYANTGAMQLHLNEISKNVGQKAHAIVLMDRAGWHTTDKLNIPENITIILLPSKAPELNPVENIWQYMRQNWLSNGVFESYEAILDAGCEAWNKLIKEPATIKSIGMRKWAHMS
ncbi:MAG: IS630 family transposase [Rhodobacteraceae bacterium]|nr:IS630 family transposase [Paracoccaceae bacterium]